MSRQAFTESPYFPLRSGTSPPWYSRLFFCWVWKLVYLGQHQVVQSKHLFRLPKYLKAKREELSLHLDSHSLLAGIALAERRFLLLSLVTNLGAASLDFVGPMYIKILSRYLTEGDQSLTVGAILLTTFAVLLFLATVLRSHALYFEGIVQNRVRNSLSSVIFDKTLKVQSVPEGMGVNLLQVDAKKIYECLTYLSAVVSIPLKLGLALALIFNEVGLGALPGLGCLLLVMVINYCMGKRIKALNEQLMELKDSRMDLSKLVYSEIRMIKAYVWESFFKDKLLRVRNAEVDVMRKKYTLWSFNIFLLWVATPLTTAVILLTYTQFFNNELTPEGAFVVFSSVSLLQHPLRTLPFAVMNIIQALISARRIQGYLDTQELVSTEQGSTTVLEACTFSYKQTNVLTDINLEIVPGEFIAVVGPVGSGKSSLLYAIMGEVTAREGHIQVDSELSYAPSLDSWLMNDTLRNNILMGAPLQEDWYWQVIEACGLEADLSVLPGRDLVEIGEKGINLSGGQKARVNLARAVYANPRTILLDDPLSSVDTHVAKHIFHRCFCQLLKGKTRILVTHRLEYLSKVDRVIQMANGQIKHITYSQNLEIAEMPPDEEHDTPQDSQEVHNLILDEEKEAGQVNKDVYAQYFACSGSVWYMGLALCVMLLWMLTMIGGDISLKEWAEHPQAPELFMLFFCVLKIGGMLLIFFRCLLILVVIALNASKKLHEQLIKNLLKVPVNLFYDVTPTGRILNRLSKDQNELDDELGLQIGSLLADVCTLACAVAIQMIYFPALLLLAGPLGFIAAKLGKMYLATARELRRLESLAKSKLLNVFGECISGLKFIRSFRKTGYFKQKNLQVLDENTLMSYNILNIKAWMMFMLASVSSTFVIVVVGLILVFHKSVGPGAIGLAISYGIILPDLMIWIVLKVTEVEKNMISTERILSYAQIPQEQPYSLPNDPTQWPVTPEIHFKSVMLKYRPTSPFILKDLSFRIAAGQRVGIVGRTGSGKSTIFIALLRLVELTRGLIEIDGVNIAKLGLKVLRQAITLIPQDPILFADTLRNNLDPRQVCSNREISTVLQELGLDQFELTHEVTGKGNNLSVGERQLISIGRALIAHKKILLLDEATAGIDNLADRTIQGLIRDKFQGCTLLVIAHRLETILDSDLVLVMDDGKLVEQGSPDELIALPQSIFSGLVSNLNH